MLHCSYFNDNFLSGERNQCTFVYKCFPSHSLCTYCLNSILSTVVRTYNSNLLHRYKQFRAVV